MFQLSGSAGYWYVRLDKALNAWSPPDYKSTQALPALCILGWYISHLKGKKIYLAFGILHNFSQKKYLIGC